MSNIWFTSDNHYYHKNIISYCNRPFPDVETMNKTMIDNHNSIVEDDDIVYNLGDFGFCSKEKIREIVEQLKGYLILIIGNHDRKPEVMLECGFDEVHHRLETTITGIPVIMTHKPLNGEDDNPSIISINGHVHDNWKFQNNSINVGVDVNNFKPISAIQMFEEFYYNKASLEGKS